MDANKRQTLQTLGYAVQRVCGMCRHAKLNGEWGECQKHTYEHQKHSTKKRHLSVVAFGSCPSFEANPAKVTEIHGFAEFLV